MTEGQGQCTAPVRSGPGAPDARTGAGAGVQPLGRLLPSAGDLSRTGVLFAAIAAVGLLLPIVLVKPNRIVLGEGLPLVAAIPAPWGWVATVALLLLALLALDGRRGLGLRLAVAAAGLAITVFVLGLAARGLMPEGNRTARVSPAGGFWMLFLAFTLMATDALSRMNLSLRARATILLAAIAVTLATLGSGWLDQTSVMIEYATRVDQPSAAASATPRTRLRLARHGLRHRASARASRSS